MEHLEHIEQLQRAIDFIEDHLHDENLTVDKISKVACISKWHFQLIFSSVIGDSLMEYIRKRRLSFAMIALGSTDQRIIEIAIHSGYETQESFSRAFKKIYGITPGECRKQGTKSLMMINKPKITIEYLNHLYKGINMKPAFKILPEFKVVGLQIKFISILSAEKNNHIVIPKLWDEYLKRQTEIQSRVNQSYFGVCFGGDESNSHPDECLYMASSEVKDDTQIPNGMISKTIPAGEYAVFTHKGHLKNLEYTMNYIMGSWLQKSGRKLRDAPDLEYYDHRFNFVSANSEIDIYIPII